MRPTVNRFVAAYNAGHFGKLDRLFPAEPGFQMYRASPERDGPLAEDRSSLIQYFRERHAYDDQLIVRMLRVSKKRSPDGHWGITFEIARTTSDPAPWGNVSFFGKGGVDCEKIYWWNSHWP